MKIPQQIWAMALVLIIPLASAIAVETQLQVTANDDGLPTSSVLSYTWSVKSAPPAATGSGAPQILTTPSTAVPTANTQNPRVVFTVPGTYVFHVVVSDGHLTTEGSASQDVTITVNPVPNNPPAIAPIADVRVAKGVSSVPVSFAITDENAIGVTLAFTSSNTALVPSANGAFSGTGGARTLTLTPVPGVTGTATITITVTDAGGKKASEAFVLTVNAPPTIVSVSASSTSLTLP